MVRRMRIGLIFGLVLCAGRADRAQTTAQTTTTPSGQRIVVAGAPADPAPNTAPITVPDTRKLTDKQRVLANEADQLLAMATELKVQVDMTNKNILSIKVVRKAEEIEQYAHVLRDRAKK